MRIDVYGLIHENESWMRAASAWRKGFAANACDLVRLSVVLIMRHAIDSRVRNRIARFVFSSHLRRFYWTSAAAARETVEEQFSDPKCYLNVYSHDSGNPLHQWQLRLEK